MITWTLILITVRYTSGWFPQPVAEMTKIHLVGVEYQCEQAAKDFIEHNRGSSAMCEPYYPTQKELEEGRL